MAPFAQTAAVSSSAGRMHVEGSSMGAWMTDSASMCLPGGQLPVPHPPVKCPSFARNATHGMVWSASRSGLRQGKSSALHQAAQKAGLWADRAA